MTFRIFRAPVFGRLLIRVAEMSLRTPGKTAMKRNGPGQFPVRGRGDRLMVIRRDQYESLEMTSPPFLVPKAHQVFMSMVDLMNRAEPSQSSTLAPPGWLLVMF